jgi:hypothetical protein
MVHDEPIATAPYKALEELAAGARFTFLIHHALSSPMDAIL